MWGNKEVREWLNATHFVRLKGWIWAVLVLAFALALASCKTLDAAKSQTKVLLEEADNAGASVITERAKQARGKLEKIK